MKPDPADSLSVIKMFACLAQDERQRIAKRCQLHFVTRGYLIIDAASPQKDVLFVIDGRVRVIDRTEFGRDVTLGEWHQGDHFGELAALDGGPRTASVVAATDCCVALMPAATFHEVLRQHSCVALALLQDLTAIIRQADQRISELSTLSANQRLCRELLRRAAPLRNDERRRVIDPLLTQEALASVTGATRETVARLLGQLRSDGLVKRIGGRLLITDAHQLTLLASGQHTRCKHTTIDDH